MFDGARDVAPFAADMWSLGVLAHCLLTEHIPFKTVANLMQYAEGKAEFPGTHLMGCMVSDNGQDFVRQLLAPCPDDRLSFSSASCHSWLESYTDE